MSIKIASAAAMMSTIGVGTIPADLQSWPVQAMLVLVTLVALGIMAYQVKAHADSTISIAASLSQLAAAQTEHSVRMNELNQKLGENVVENKLLRVDLGNLKDELHNRPCVMGKKRGAQT